MDRIKTPAFLMVVGALIYLPFFFHSGFNGYDSYSFLNEVCMENNPHSPINKVPSVPFIEFFQSFLLDLIPCNELFIKGMLLFLFLSSLMMTRALGIYSLGQKGWLAPYLLFLVPANFLFFFMKFENDTLGFPLGLLGIVLLAKSHYINKAGDLPIHLYLIAGMSLIGLGGIIWGGNGVVLVGASLLSPLHFVVSLPSLFLTGKSIFLGIGENPIILENHLVVGLASMTILNIGFFSPILGPLTYFVGVSTFLSGKFSLIASTLLSVSTVKFLHKHYPRNILHYSIIVLFLVSIIFGIYSSIWLVENIHPSKEEFSAVNHSINLHLDNGKSIINEFWYGYLLDSAGYVSKYYGFLTPEWDQNISEKIVISHDTLDCPNQSFGNLYVYDC